MRTIGKPTIWNWFTTVPISQSVHKIHVHYLIKVIITSIASSILDGGTVDNEADDWEYSSLGDRKMKEAFYK